MAVPDVVKRLVYGFAQYESRYTHPGYNETDARRDLIDPLFSALGWDVGGTLHQSSPAS